MPQFPCLVNIQSAVCPLEFFGDIPHIDAQGQYLSWEVTSEQCGSVRWIREAVSLSHHCRQQGLPHWGHQNESLRGKGSTEFVTKF